MQGKPIFVYGSLKQGGKWHHLLEDSTLIDTADVIFGEMYLHITGLYPLLFPGTDEIGGEIYMIDTDVHKKLVELEEGYEERSVTTKKGREVRVFFYQDAGAKSSHKRIAHFDVEQPGI